MNSTSAQSINPSAAAPSGPSKLVHGVGLLGLLLLLGGSVMGLLWAPPEQHMGDVSRIVFVHVPAAWNCLLIFTFACGFAVWSLWSGTTKADAAMVASVEVGIVLNALMIVTGMLFARPTWGIWWDWDVRLTTSFISLIFFGGVLAMRSLIDDPRQRATWSAVAAIIGYVDVPIIYFCVRWWRSLHQIQSTTETMSPGIVLPMRINAFAILFISIWFLSMRAAIERNRVEASGAAPPARLPETSEGTA